MANNYIDLPQSGGSGSGVSSLNSLTGALSLVAGSGITITPSGTNITIAATGGGSGTVTSVGLVDSTGLFTVTNSPVTTSGNLTLSALASQTANTFLAAPNGSSGAPAFRAILAADVPTLNQNTTGTAANITASSNSTLTTLSVLSLPGSQVSGNIAGNAANISATTNATLVTLSSLSLPGAQVTGNIAGNAANITASSNSTLTTLSALSLPTSQLSGSIVLTSQVSGILPVANGGTGISTGLVESFGITIDGGGSAITNGTYSVRSMPTAGVITSWVLLADTTGSITVDIKKSTFSGYPTTASITAAAIPAISAAQKNSSSTLTGWTTSFAAGDVMQFVVSGSATVTKVTLTVLYTRA